jgi:hypothetical protein
MRSSISSTIAEIFLQHYENLFIKNGLESTSVTYYSRYVGGAFIIFNAKNTTEDTILNNMNSINNYVAFKMTEEENNTINCLDLTITRYTDRLELDIFHKSTATSTMIHAQFNHQKEHKAAAYRYYIERLHKLFLSEDKETKTDIVKQIDLDNGYTHGMINHLTTKFSNTNGKILHKKRCIRNVPLSHFSSLLSEKSPTYLRTHNYA